MIMIMMTIVMISMLPIMITLVGIVTDVSWRHAKKADVPYDSGDMMIMMKICKCDSRCSSS